MNIPSCTWSKNVGGYLPGCTHDGTHQVVLEADVPQGTETRYGPFCETHASVALRAEKDAGRNAHMERIVRAWEPGMPLGEGDKKIIDEWHALSGKLEALYPTDSSAMSASEMLERLVKERDDARAEIERVYGARKVTEEVRLMAAIDRADRDVGVYRKFWVARVDGSSAVGQKHEHCEYFVLDWEHDRFARAAALAYAAACEDDFPLLAADLRARAGDKA